MPAYLKYSGVLIIKYINLISLRTSEYTLSLLSYNSSPYKGLTYLTDLFLTTRRQYTLKEI